LWSGHWKEALDVCKKMTEKGVGPDLVTHNWLYLLSKGVVSILKLLFTLS